MNKMVTPYILTGYETIIPIKAGSKFAVIAEEDGVVTSVTSNNIEVEYKNKGKVKYNLYKWTSKEEAGSCYTHEMVANLEKGMKFLKDDTITYDKLFFEPCLFSPRRVIYKQGAMVNVMLSEDTQTNDDSMTISGRLNKELGTTLTKVKSVVVSKDDNIIDLIDIDKKVEPTTTLMTVLNSDVPANEKLDSKALEILKEFGAISPKAKIKGKVSKIVAYYNFDKDEATPSLKKVIEYSDKILTKLHGYTGKITTGYSIQGVPLAENSCEIKIYIDVNESLGTGDKCILGNQLKCTVGEVFDYGMTTESGDNIDAVFSNTSISARIVNSPNLIGTTSTILKKIEEVCIKMYF